MMDTYFAAVDQLLQRIKTTQAGNIQKAADLMAESVAHGGAIHIHDTGHIINAELISRAGGLMLMKQLQYSFTINNPVRNRDRKGIDTSQEGLARYVLNASNVLPGDVLVIGSVSGKSQAVVDLALAAKDMGVKLVVVTSVTYSSQVKSDHSSGKRLFELGDVVLDNCAPTGDAMLEMEGLEVKACPASGIAATVIMWAVTSEVIERLIAQGITPSVYKSANYPGGPEYNLKLEERYKEKGY